MSKVKEDVYMLDVYNNEKLEKNKDSLKNGYYKIANNQLMIKSMNISEIANALGSIVDEEVSTTKNYNDKFSFVIKKDNNINNIKNQLEDFGLTICKKDFFVKHYKYSQKD